MKKKIIIKIIILITLMSYFLKEWIISYYGNISFDQILFHIINPIKGVEKSIVITFILNCLIYVILYYIIIINFIKLIKISKKIDLYKLNKTLIIAISIFVIVFIYVLYDLKVIEYFSTSNKNSSFIEENYIEPQKVSLTFPLEKRNLIYILVESLESTYYSQDLGGQLKENLMPELYELSKENITFSDTNLLGGAYEINGTSWTTAGLVSQTSGIIVKVPNEWTNNKYLKDFMKGAYSIGQILEKEGYNQTFMLGSNSNFGNIKEYLKNHGNYKIYDYYSAIEDKKIDKDYKVWWGFEDSKLFKYAKEEATKLYQKGKPFNLSISTSNTHFPNGYLEKQCESKYKDNYSNTIACTSKQIYNFISWVKEQEFYENTTIVIVGDHLSMDSKFFKNYNLKKENRRIFNLFINPNIDTKDINYNNRLFSSVDIYPTTLASLGIQIENNKLGLGTNLFSDEKTLIEKYGLNELNKQLTYKSSYYNQKILGYKK